MQECKSENTHLFFFFPQRRKSENLKVLNSEAMKINIDMPTLGYFNLIVELLNNSYFLTKISKLKLYEDLSSVLLFPSDSWIAMGFVFQMS